MELLDLPNELLVFIVTYSLPEGFDNLALTCKHFQSLCAPFVEHHNTLRQKFQDFMYNRTKQHMGRTVRHPLPNTISSAFNLIAIIAVEPIVAQYIHMADFRWDNQLLEGENQSLVTDQSRDKAVRRLLADSAVLKQAGLDWKKYYAVIEKDFNAARYSQHAAAFLLTLIPNAEVLWLPERWKPEATTDKLIKTVISNARHNPDGSTSLAKVIQVVMSGGAEHRFDLDSMHCFLALPHVQWFTGMCSEGGTYSEAALKYTNLETVWLYNASMSEVELSNFLRRTPRLKTLRFTPFIEEDSWRDWDLCKFVMTIEQIVGNHLVNLCITLSDAVGTSIAPGQASMRGFKKLKRLELPLETVLCNLEAGLPRNPRSLVRDFIPASLTHLAFDAYGTD